MPENHLILEWGSNDGYLLHQVLPNTPRLPLNRGDTPVKILAQIPQQVKTVWWHINLTRPDNLIPQMQQLNRAMTARGIRVVNGNLCDISKSSLMEHVQNAGGRVPVPVDNDWVIVKTDNNHAGIMDSKLIMPAANSEVPLNDPLMIFNPKKYPVLKYDEVPPTWKSSKHVVIQRYITNSTSYFIRAYFLGNSLVTSVARSGTEVKRMSSYTERRQIQYATNVANSDMLKQLNLARRAVSAEFGTADLVIDDFFKCWVVDINSTPFLGEGEFGEITSVLCNDDLVKNA